MTYIEKDIRNLNLKTWPNLRFVTKWWLTATYEIFLDNIDGIDWLRISKRDNSCINSYMDMQQIKNDLLGEEVIAVEVFPKQSVFKNGTNARHLWAHPSMVVPCLKKIQENRAKLLNKSKGATNK